MARLLASLALIGCLVGCATSSRFTISEGSEAKVITVDASPLPVGSSTSRDFTAVVDLAPTASRDAAGISLAGTTGTESAYAVDGANIQTLTSLPTTPRKDPASTDDLDDDARQIVYTAELQVAVHELDAAIEFAESLPTRYGGWIAARYDYQITLRLPAEKLFEAIELLGALGVVLGKTLRTDDVTAEFTDLESRILVLEQLVEQLEILLAKARTVEETLRVRAELDRVRLELEAARVRMRQLSELIAFSTLTLHLSQRGPVDALPASNDPFPWVDELGVESTEYR